MISQNSIRLYLKIITENWIDFYCERTFSEILLLNIAMQNTSLPTSIFQFLDIPSSPCRGRLNYGYGSVFNE